MSAGSRMRFACVILAFLSAGNLPADEITIDVSSDQAFPWNALHGETFSVGFGGTSVEFTTSDSSYAGAPYTSVRTGLFLNTMGWTTVYTLLARDMTPIHGAYLALTLGSAGNVTYSYSLDPSQTWNTYVNNFSIFSPATWTDVANFLFPPPPPPPPIVPDTTFLPPPVIITPAIGLPVAGGPLAVGPAVDNPEPGTALLLLSGAVLCWFGRRRRARV